MDRERRNLVSNQTIGIQRPRGVPVVPQPGTVPAEPQPSTSRAAGYVPPHRPAPPQPPQQQPAQPPQQHPPQPPQQPAQPPLIQAPPAAADDVEGCQSNLLKKLKIKNNHFQIS